MLWIVWGFIAAGVITEIVGKLKASGKTTFVAWMVRAILDGLDFLGGPTHQTPVVWLTDERPPSFLEHTRSLKTEYHRFIRAESA